MRTNATKAKLNGGEVVFGAIISRHAPDLVELFGALGYDFVMIDCEHGSHDYASVLEMVLACEVSGVTPIVRLPVNRPDVILRYLDRGTMGVHVPHVNTKDEAVAAVRAVQFHPEGDRGVGGGRKWYGMSTT